MFGGVVLWLCAGQDLGAACKGHDPNYKPLLAIHVCLNAFGVGNVFWYLVVLGVFPRHCLF